jgi:hypothetical protein
MRVRAITEDVPIDEMAEVAAISLPEKFDFELEMLVCVRIVKETKQLVVTPIDPRLTAQPPEEPMF